MAAGRRCVFAVIGCGCFMRFSLHVPDHVHTHGIWQFVIARKMIWRDSPTEIRNFLGKLVIAHLDGRLA